MELAEAAQLLHMSVTGLRSAIQADRCPVPSYKLGRRIVIDRQVMARFFDEQRKAGLAELEQRPRRSRHPVKERRAAAKGEV